jgi:hypothetical protein
MDRQAWNNVVVNVGCTRRERNINKAQSDFLRLEKDSPSFKDVLIDGEARNLIIYAATMQHKKNICSIPGERFEIGNIVTYNDAKYIILRADADDDVYTRGYMERCNWLLKWQDETDEIVSCDCEVLTASQYNSGEYANKTVTIGSNQFAIFLPLNKDTIKLKADKRFFIDNNTVEPIPYRLTRVDTVSSSYYGVGCVSLIVTQDQFNEETDNVELGICDYKIPEVVPTSDIKITYIGDPVIRCGGTAKTFTASEDVTFSFEVAAGTNNIILTQTDDDKCTLKCLNKTEMIGTTIKLKFTNGTDSSYIYVDIISNV